MGIDMNQSFREEAELDIHLNADKYREKWKNETELYRLARLLQEVAELGSALVGDHEGSPERPLSPEHELRQIGGITLNWLAQRYEDKLKGGV